jgi:hypothetical protein
MYLGMAAGASSHDDITSVQSLPAAVATDRYSYVEGVFLWHL